MLPVSFPQVNKVLGKPSGWKDDQCDDLPVCKCNIPIDDKGTAAPAIISCWALSKEDLEEVARTGKIWLSIVGTAMPPVSLYTENPFLTLPTKTG